LEETAGGLEGGAEGHGLIILLVFRFRVDGEFANNAKSMRGGVERCQKVSTYWWEVMFVRFSNPRHITVTIPGSLHVCRVKLHQISRDFGTCASRFGPRLVGLNLHTA
jgi:hypothetical protein